MPSRPFYDFVVSCCCWHCSIGQQALEVDEHLGYEVQKCCCLDAGYFAATQSGEDGPSAAQKKRDKEILAKAPESLRMDTTRVEIQKEREAIQTKIRNIMKRT